MIPIQRDTLYTTDDQYLRPKSTKESSSRTYVALRSRVGFVWVSWMM